MTEHTPTTVEQSTETVTPQYILGWTPEAKAYVRQTGDELRSCVEGAENINPETIEAAIVRHTEEHAIREVQSPEIDRGPVSPRIQREIPQSFSIDDQHTGILLLPVSHSMIDMVRQAVIRDVMPSPETGKFITMDHGKLDKNQDKLRA